MPSLAGPWHSALPKVGGSALLPVGRQTQFWAGWGQPPIDAASISAAKQQEGPTETSRSQRKQGIAEDSGASEPAPRGPLQSCSVLGSKPHQLDLHSASGGACRHSTWRPCRMWASGGHQPRNSCGTTRSKPCSTSDGFCRGRGRCSWRYAKMCVSTRHGGLAKDTLSTIGRLTARQATLAGLRACGVPQPACWSTRMQQVSASGGALCCGTARWS